MHISSHILKEQVHFQSRVCELFLAAYTAFSSQVAIARHPYIHVGQCCGGSGVLFTCFGLRSDGAALVWPCPRISQGSAFPIEAILPGSLASFFYLYSIQEMKLNLSSAMIPFYVLFWLYIIR